MFFVSEVLNPKTQFSFTGHVSGHQESKTIDYRNSLSETTPEILVFDNSKTQRVQCFSSHSQIYMILIKDLIRKQTHTAMLRFWHKNNVKRVKTQ